MTDDTIPAEGATRRLQALAWMGYDIATLETRTGIMRPVALSLLWNPPARIPERLHKVIAAKYRELMITSPDATKSSRQIAAVARAAGWVSPLGWDDIDTGTRATAAHNAKDAAQWAPGPGTTEPHADPDEIQQLRTENARLTALAEHQEADLTQILQNQRRADHEHVAACAALDEYAALKLKAEADAASLRDERDAALKAVQDLSAVTDRQARAAKEELERAREAATILREQVTESESRVTAATKRAMRAEREAKQLQNDILLEQEAYRRLQASSRQLQQSFDELSALHGRSDVHVIEPASTPQLNQVVVEETPDGTRVVFTSRRHATVRFGDLDISIPALLGRASA